MEFEIRITEKFLKEAHFRRLFSGWKKILFAFGLIILAVIIDIYSGELGKISVIGLTVMLICILIYSAAWYRQCREVRKWLEKQEETPVRYNLLTMKIEAESLIGSTTLKWTAFKRLVIHPHDTLLEFSQAGALTLPTEQIPPPALLFLIERFTKHNLEIKDFRKKI